jgi:hypothetical protein
MGLKQTHKKELKMKSICTNQKNKMMINTNWNQIGA